MASCLKVLLSFRHIVDDCTYTKQCDSHFLIPMNFRNKSKMSATVDIRVLYQHFTTFLNAPSFANLVEPLMHL